MFSGFISTAAYVINITSMINHLLTSFSAAQIYDADLTSSTEISMHSSKREENAPNGKCLSIFDHQFLYDVIAIPFSSLFLIQPLVLPLLLSLFPSSSNISRRIIAAILFFIVLV